LFLGLHYLKLILPPPSLPSISNYNIGVYESIDDPWGLDTPDAEWEFDVDQLQWEAGKRVEITERLPRIYLSGDRELEGLKISNPRGDYNRIGLNGHRLVLGEAGLVLGTVGPSVIYDGVLTSSSGQIKINSIFDSIYLTQIESVISDNGDLKVGVDLVRSDQGSGGRGIWLAGDQSNTFTGDFNLKGIVRVNLAKKGGAIAISGNLNITNGAAIRILRNEQINDKSRVLLKSGSAGASHIQFHGHEQADITETFHQLVVDGTNVLDFGGGDKEGYRHGIRKLILDDLEILDGGHLVIAGWANQRDFLLVRKDSEHLQDALKKLSFSGQPNRIHFVDYNKDYWEISNAPEPAVYGAVIGALGACLATRKRKRPFVSA